MSEHPIDHEYCKNLISGLVAEKRRLRLALNDMVRSTEEWNEAVRTIIGRVPGTGIDLVKAQCVLDETKEKES